MANQFREVEPLDDSGVHARFRDGWLEVDDGDRSPVRFDFDEAVLLRHWLIRATRPDPVGGKLTPAAQRAHDALDQIRERVNAGDCEFADMQVDGSSDEHDEVDFRLRLSKPDKKMPADMAAAIAALDAKLAAQIATLQQTVDNMLWTGVTKRKPKAKRASRRRK